jgi:hypothetical protein
VLKWNRRALRFEPPAAKRGQLLWRSPLQPVRPPLGGVDPPSYSSPDERGRVTLLLGGSQLFSIFDGPARLKIAERANERSIPPGAAIFSEGDPTQSVMRTDQERDQVLQTLVGQRQPRAHASNQRKWWALRS